MWPVGDIFHTPETRTFACPGCGKGCKQVRIGNSSSYWSIDPTDDKKDHACGYKGPIPIKLLGYVPNKGKKHET